MVECAGFENRSTSNRCGSSNLPLSAELDVTLVNNEGYVISEAAVLPTVLSSAFQRHRLVAPTTHLINAWMILLRRRFTSTQTSGRRCPKVVQDAKVPPRLQARRRDAR